MKHTGMRKHAHAICISITYVYVCICVCGVVWCVCVCVCKMCVFAGVRVYRLVDPGEQNSCHTVGFFLFFSCQQMIYF